MNSELEELFSKFNGSEFQEEDLELLKGMLKISERESFTIRKAKEALNQFLDAVGMEHCHGLMEDAALEDEDGETEEETTAEDSSCDYSE